MTRTMIFLAAALTTSAALAADMPEFDVLFCVEEGNPDVVEVYCRIVVDGDVNNEACECPEGLTPFELVPPPRPVDAPPPPKASGS